MQARYLLRSELESLRGPQGIPAHILAELAAAGQTVIFSDCYSSYNGVIAGPGSRDIDLR